jgi:hypothetical protein
VLYVAPYFHPTPCMLSHRAVLCPQWDPRNAAVRAARYYSVLHRTTLKMLVCRRASSYHVHSAHCTHTYMHGRACANARVVSRVSRTCTAIYTFTGIILSLRCVASKASSIHLPCHNVKKFALIVSNLPRAKFSQHGKLCVWGGRRVVVHVMVNRLLHSKRRKKKAFATRH